MPKPALPSAIVRSTIQARPPRRPTASASRAAFLSVRLSRSHANTVTSLHRHPPRVEARFATL